MLVIETLWMILASYIVKIIINLLIFLGTNDKAGGPHYILRWTSPQSVKETFVPLTEWKYPYMN